MTLTELRYAAAVAQERHFGRAAAVCHVSQPTLSIAVRKLEDELGIVIFDRSASEVLLTDVGRRLCTQIDCVLEEVDKIHALVERGQNDLAGSFRLGLIFTVAPYLLPKMILSLNAMAPHMPLILEEHYTVDLMTSLKKGDLDAIVVAEPIKDATLNMLPLYEEPFFAIVPKGHSLEARDEISMRDLTKENVLLLTKGNCMRDNILTSCKELASQQLIRGLANTLQGSSITTIRHMVASGMGISLMPSTSLMEGDEQLFSIIPFKHPAPTRKIVLVYRKHFVRPQALLAIRDAVLQSSLRGVRLAEAVDLPLDD